MRILLPSALLVALLALPGAAEAAAPIVDVRLLTPSASGEPQQSLSFDVELVNRGAGSARVAFEILEETGGFRAFAPQPVTLEAAGGEGARRVVPVSVLTPFENGNNQDSGVIRVGYVATDPDSGLAGTRGELTLRASSSGFYALSPAWLPAAALALAAIATRRRSTSARLALVAVALALPGASASGMRVDLADPASPEAPGSRFSVPFTARVPCELVGDESTLRFAVERAPAWAIATPSPAVVELASRACPGADFAIDGALTVTLSTRAPAGEAAGIRLGATLAGGRAGEASYDETLVVASFVADVDVRVPFPAKVGKPQTFLEFPIELENRGNANTKVAFTAEPVSGGFQLPLPAPVTLASVAEEGGAAKQTVSFTVSTPFRNGPNHGSATITVHWRATNALNESLPSDAGSFTLVARVEGNYVPAPAPLLLVGLLAGLAVLAQRDRSSIVRPRAPREPKD